MVIKVSAMAHLAVGFLTLGLLVPILIWPASAALLVMPVVLSTLIIRLRTAADVQGVTVRTLLTSQTVRWDDIDGLRGSPEDLGPAPSSRAARNCDCQR